MGKYQRKWNLDNVYPGIDSKEFQKDYEYLQKEVTKLLEKANNLPEIDTSKSSADQWEKFFRDFEEYQLVLEQMYGYINNKSSAHAEDDKYPVWLGKLSNIVVSLTPIDIRMRFLLRECDGNTFDKFINNNDYLNKIQFAIREIRKYAKYMMDKDREELAAKLSQDGIRAWGRLYDKVSGRLKVKVMEKGEIVEKSVGQVRTDLKERTVRQNNFYASIKAWDTIKHLCAEALNHISGTRLTLYKEQGYKHFLDKPLLDNRMTRETLDAMWGAVNDKKDMFKKYFEVKAGLLGLDKLSWYDIKAPTGSGNVDFDTAMDTVIQEYKKFSPEMGEFVKNAAEKGFIESEDREGKRQGAYCMGFSKRKEPRVFMTFTDSYSSMSTLAHELGHAYHGYVLRDRPLELQQYPMNLAETASTFGEAIIGDYLLNNAKDEKEKMAMLDKMIGDAATFAMNIHCRFIFEYNFYEKREQGELTPDELTQMMLDAQREAYIGLLDEYNPMFWASKLHFYIAGLSFYNFPYTFGYLFSNTLYSIGKEKGNDFAETYKQILIDTGCKKTEDVIKDNIGMDITKKDFWFKSLDLVQKRIDEYVRLNRG
jgi:oligoendopeptidase F